jgi:hypothetical protein
MYKINKIEIIFIKYLTSIITNKSIMSNQILNNFESESVPDIAKKIKELSATKHVLLNMIMQMYPMSINPILSVYAGPMIKLLQRIVNIHKNAVLLKLEDALTSVLITYIFDINELIKGHLDLEKYEPRHKNLVAVHQQIDYHLKQNDLYNLAELKATLFLI